MSAAQPSFAEAFKVWAKIGCLSFGGPAGQIALMHRIVVDEKKWLPDARFLHALNFSMLLPGPEATQLATYIGWLLHGVRGGLAAGILFVLPGAFVMLALSLLYVYGRGLGAIDGALFGIKAAVLVIVVEALIRIGKRSLKSNLLVALAGLGFVGIFFFARAVPADRHRRRADRTSCRAAGARAARAANGAGASSATAARRLAAIRLVARHRSFVVVGARAGGICCGSAAAMCWLRSACSSPSSRWCRSAAPMR